MIDDHTAELNNINKDIQDSKTKINQLEANQARILQLAKQRKLKQKQMAE